MKNRKPRNTKLPEGHRSRYGWSRATRGKYAAKAAKASELLRVLEPELARRFPDSRTVNAALRKVLDLKNALPRRRGSEPRRIAESPRRRIAAREVRNFAEQRRRSV